MKLAAVLVLGLAVFAAVAIAAETETQTPAVVGTAADAEYTDDNNQLYDKNGVLLISEDGSPLVQQPSLLEEEAVQTPRAAHKDSMSAKYLPEAEYTDDEGRIYDKHGKQIKSETGLPLVYMNGFLSEEVAEGTPLDYAEYVDDDGYLYDKDRKMLLDEHGYPFLHPDAEKANVNAAHHVTEDKPLVQQVLFEQAQEQGQAATATAEQKRIAAEAKRYQSEPYSSSDFDYVTEADPRYKRFMAKAEYFDDDGKLYDSAQKVITDDEGYPVYHQFVKSGPAASSFLETEVAVGSKAVDSGAKAALHKDAPSVAMNAPMSEEEKARYNIHQFVADNGFPVDDKYYNNEYGHADTEFIQDAVVEGPAAANPVNQGPETSFAQESVKTSPKAAVAAKPAAPVAPKKKTGAAALIRGTALARHLRRELKAAPADPAAPAAAEATPDATEAEDDEPEAAQDDDSDDDDEEEEAKSGPLKRESAKDDDDDDDDEAKDDDDDDDEEEESKRGSLKRESAKDDDDDDEDEAKDDDDDDDDEEETKSALKRERSKDDDDDDDDEAKDDDDSDDDEEETKSSLKRERSKDDDDDDDDEAKDDDDSDDDEEETKSSLKRERSKDDDDDDEDEAKDDDSDDDEDEAKEEPEAKAAPEATTTPEATPPSPLSPLRPSPPPPRLLPLPPSRHWAQG